MDSLDCASAITSSLGTDDAGTLSSGRLAGKGAVAAAAPSATASAFGLATFFGLAWCTFAAAFTFAEMGGAGDGAAG